MIELYYWPTPNGHKITLFLEEAGLAYRIIPVDLGTGAQFQPAFRAIAPNNRMPAIIDTAPSWGGDPISLFESGAILVYLAEKTGMLLPTEAAARAETLQWLFWQAAGLGPIAGQNGHFSHHAPERLPYAIARYVEETNRLFGVMNRHLADRNYLAGTYSIADIACYPWIAPYERLGQRLADFPDLERWFEAIAARPATRRAYDRAAEIPGGGAISAEVRARLFGG